jgi:hypothetical protein
MDSFKSKETIIFCNVEKVFNKVSNPGCFKGLVDQLPADAKDKLKDATFSDDAITIKGGPVGEVTLKVTEKEPFSKIIFTAVQSPVPLNAIVYLEKVGEEETKAIAELSVALPVFLRPMASKPLQQGAEKLAEFLRVLPYDKL